MTTQWTTDKLFNRERFEAWLAEQPGERVFEYGNCTECAVSSFVKETTSEAKPSCADTYVSMAGFTQAISLPQWLYFLLRHVRMDFPLDDAARFTIAQLRTTYHKLFNIDVMEAHAPITLTPQPERV